MTRPAGDVVEAQFDFSGGLNNRVNARYIKANQISAGQNCECLPSGPVTIRGGMVAANSTTATQIVYANVFSLGQYASLPYMLTRESFGAAGSAHPVGMLESNARINTYVKGAIKSIVNSTTGTVVTGSATNWLATGFEGSGGGAIKLLHLKMITPAFLRSSVKSIDSDTQLHLDATFTGTTTASYTLIQSGTQLTARQSCDVIQVGNSVYAALGKQEADGTVGTRPSLWRQDIWGGLVQEWRTFRQGGVGAPTTVSVTGAEVSTTGSLGTGTYKVCMTFRDFDTPWMNANFESNAGGTTSVTLTTLGTGIGLSALQQRYFGGTTSSTAWAPRRIYRTIVGGSVFYLDTELTGSTTDCVLTKADSALDTGVSPPTDHDVAPSDLYLLCWHKGRMWAVSSEFQNRIYFSGQAATTPSAEAGGLFQPEYWPSTNYVSVDVDRHLDSDMVVALVSYNERLYLFRRNGIWILDDSNTDTAIWRWRQMRGGVGALGRVGQTADSLYFASLDGKRYRFYMMSGGGIQDITGDLFLEVASNDKMFRVDCSAVDSRVYVAISTGSTGYVPPTTYEGAMYVWHRETGAWSPFVLDGSKACPVLAVGDRGGAMALYGAREGGVGWITGYPFSGTSDTGTKIDWFVETREIGGGKNGAYWGYKKSFHYVEFEISVGATALTGGLLSYSLDGGSYTALPVDRAANFTCGANTRKRIRCNLPDAVRGDRLKFKFRENEKDVVPVLYWWRCSYGVIGYETEPKA